MKMQNGSANSRILGECVFLDVGQGSANAILLRDRSVILIDTGTRDAWNVLERLLEDFAVRSIECVVLSHNDDDHIGGWEQCAMTYGDKIKSIYLVHDRKIVSGKTIDITWKLAKDRVIPEPRRAEQGEIWKGGDFTLEIVYPNMRAATTAFESNRKNDCSAVALFRYSKGSVLFTGDAGDATWQALRAANGGKPMKVNMATIPHHGSANAARYFSEAVQADIGIVSVSTHNSYGHPSPVAVKACLAKGMKIVCTQITSQCHPIEDFGGENVMVVPEHSLSYSQIGNIGCGGTITSVLTDDGIEHDWRNIHDQAIQGLDSPMCARRVTR